MTRYYDLRTPAQKEQIDPPQGRHAREQAHWQKAQEPEQENQAL